MNPISVKTKTMKRTKLINLLAQILFLFIVVDSAWADLQGELDRMVGELGVTSAASAPGVYEGQTRGYLTGGSLLLRSPRSTLQPFTATAPKLRAGCEGIDFYLGSLSYINLQDFVIKLQAIGTNAAGYAFQLSLTHLCPSCAGVLEAMEKATREINALNVSSCQAARTLVDGTVGMVQKISASNQSRCEDSMVASGAAADRVQAREMCQANPAAGEQNGDAQDREHARQNKNFLWEALKGVPLDRDTRELFQSLLGTLVMDPNGLRYYPPLLQFSDFIEGGSVPLYTCPSTIADPADLCLSPGQNMVTVQGLTVQVKALLVDVLGKLRAAQPLTSQEQDLITTAPIPLYRILSRLSSLPPAIGEAYLIQTSEQVSVLLAAGWIDYALKEIEKGLPTAKIEGAALEWFRDGIKEARSSTARKLSEVKVSVDLITAELERLQKLDQLILRNIENQGLGESYRFGQRGK